MASEGLLGGQTSAEPCTSAAQARGLRRALSAIDAPPCVWQSLSQRTSSPLPPAPPAPLVVASSSGRSAARRTRDAGGGLLRPAIAGASSARSEQQLPPAFACALRPQVFIPAPSAPAVYSRCLPPPGRQGRPLPLQACLCAMQPRSRVPVARLLHPDRGGRCSRDALSRQRSRGATRSTAGAKLQPPACGICRTPPNFIFGKHARMRSSCAADGPATGARGCRAGLRTEVDSELSTAGWQDEGRR